MKVIIALFFMCAFSNTYAQLKESRIEYIKKNGVNVDKASFASFKTAFGNARIVGLGEQSHGDGATYDFKVEMIKYMHEEMGFNIIAFESGFYDCSKANLLIKESKSANNNFLLNSIFPIWQTTEIRKLSDYIISTRNTPNPLILTGFDCQFSGEISKKFLAGDLEQLLITLNADGLIESSEWSMFKKGLESLIKYSNFFAKIKTEERLNINKVASSIRSLLAEKKNLTLHNKVDFQYWDKVLDNIMYENLRKDSSENFRDSIMADNLLWLSTNQFKDQKIMLWAASSHLAYNPKSINATNFENYIPMGDYLKKKLKNDYYFMGITAYEGKRGHGVLSSKVNKPSDDSIEELLYQSGSEKLFLNFRKANDNLWLNNKINSKPFGFVEMPMYIGNIMDGIMYFKSMSTAHWLKNKDLILDSNSY